MSMTEKEAKEKLCPFAISGSWIAHNMNGCGAYHCDASDCMAWEWDYKNRNTHVPNDCTIDDEPIRPDRVPLSWEWESASDSGDGVASWIEPESEAKERWTGHCHLIFRGAE